MHKIFVVHTQIRLQFLRVTKMRHILDENQNKPRLSRLVIVCTDIFWDIYQALTLSFCSQWPSRFEKLLAPPQKSLGIFSDIKHRICAMRCSSFVYNGSVYVNLATFSGYKTALCLLKITD